MRYFRFAVSLLANLAMTVIGGFLSYMGIVGFALTVQVLLFLEMEIDGSGTTLNDALGAANGGRMDFFGDATPWLIMSGEVLIGLPLLAFGIFGLLRRLRDGLPDEDDGVAETPVGRIAQALVYCAGGLIGFGLLSLTLLDVLDYVSLVSGSERAEAVIEKNWRSNGSRDGDMEGPGYYVLYRFNTHAGETFVTKTQVPVGAGKEFAEGNRIIVTYLPEDPSVNEWEELRSLSDYAPSLIFYLILIVGGTWGARRCMIADAEIA